jgi:hypothetical protein
MLVKEREEGIEKNNFLKKLLTILSVKFLKTFWKKVTFNADLLNEK